MMVAYGANELVSSSDFAKKFGSYLAQIKDNSVEKLAILRNNKVEAVLISKEEYEGLKEATKSIEAREILSSVQKGLDDVRRGKIHKIDTLWDKLGD